MNEKEIIKLKNNLRFTTNGLRSSWGYKRFNVWADVWTKIGYKESNYPSDHPKDKVVVWEDLLAYINKLEKELDERIKRETVGTTTPHSSSNDKAGETVKELPPVNVAPKEVGDSKTQAPIPQALPTPAITLDEPQRSTTTPPVVLPDGVQSTGATTQGETKTDTETPASTAKGTVTQDSSIVTQALSELNEQNDYGFTPSPNERVSHYWFQKKAITEAWHKLFVQDLNGLLILAPTGTGKTFIVAALQRRLLDSNYHEGKTFSHIPYLSVTRSTVVEQTGRVLQNFYNISPNVDVEVINIEQLRSSRGKFWVKEIVKMYDGVEVSEWKWKPFVQPCVLFLDESQGAKNKTSSQSQIIYAYNDIEKNAKLVCISATPFTRVSEAQAFAVSTKRDLSHLGFPAGTTLNNKNWPEYAKIIAAPASPEDHNEAAIDRLMKDLDKWVVRVKNVRPQFEAQNKVEMISFETREEREFYNNAWNRFLEEKRKKEEEVDGSKFMFVILLKFAMAAEKCRAAVLARRAYQKVKDGKAAVIACKFKGTIIEVVKILNEKYGVSRDEMSLVWGGGQTQLTAKQKAKAKIKQLKDKLEGTDLTVDDMIETMGLEDVEDREMEDLPEHLRLESQSTEERQEEIDKFQSGKSLYCMFTFRAGGVGLSLHHTDELTVQKVRHKKSGYAVEEDIPLIPVRPRDVDVAPTYSAVELVQGLGRCPRLTSLSATKQTLLFYKDTVEEDIADIVSDKLRCLGRVVRQKEAWSDVIVGGDKNKYKETGELVDEDDGIIGGEE